MTSIFKILLIIAIIYNYSGYALYDGYEVLNLPDSQVSDTPDNEKRDPSDKRKCDDINGCDIHYKSLDYPLDRDFYELIGPKDQKSANSRFAISKLPGLRERQRRQAVVKKTRDVRLKSFRKFQGY